MSGFAGGETTKASRVPAVVVTDPASSVWLHERSWRDVEDYLDGAAHPTVLVPIGSTEQHGRHLPLGVDGFAARDLAEAIAERAGVLSAPPIWYGDAAHHMAFPGTVSLSTETVVALLVDVYESLLRHGFENVVTVSGHSIANLPAVKTASKRAREAHPDAFFAIVDRFRIGVRAHRDLREDDDVDGMHADEFETSLMLRDHPDLVDLSALPGAADAEPDGKADDGDDAGGERTDDEEGGNWSRFVSNDHVTLDDEVEVAPGRHDWDDDAPGHRGSPARASVETGERLAEVFVGNAVEFIDDLHARRAEEREDGTDAS